VKIEEYELSQDGKGKALVPYKWAAKPPNKKGECKCSYRQKEKESV